MVHAPAYDAVNDRVLFMVNADGTSARYLVAYKVGQGIVWMVPVNSNDTLPQRGRFLYEQIWTYGGQAVTVRSAEDGEVLFRQTGFPHDNSVGTGDVRPRQQRPLCRWRQPGRRLPDRRRPRIG